MNMQYDLKAFAKKVKKHQEKERYEHTKGVIQQPHWQWLMAVI